MQNKRKLMAPLKIWVHCASIHTPDCGIKQTFRKWCFDNFKCNNSLIKYNWIIKVVFLCIKWVNKCIYKKYFHFSWPLKIQSYMVRLLSCGKCSHIYKKLTYQDGLPICLVFSLCLIRLFINWSRWKDASIKEIRDHNKK